MGLVYKIAKTKNVLKDEDAVQYGFYGLCRAAESFDPNYGTEFSTYASHYIKHWLKGKYADEKYRERVGNGSYIITDDVAKYSSDLIFPYDDTRMFLSDIMSKVDDCTKEILKMIYCGYQQKQIVCKLNISSKKYYNKIRNVKERFGDERN